MFISLPFFCYETVSFFPFSVHVSLTLLCESTANWQPVITTHLPCSAPAPQPTFFLKHNCGTFLIWTLGNSIYLRSVAAEFALSSIGFGKIGVKTPDKIMKGGILLEPGNKRCLWGEAEGPPQWTLGSGVDSGEEESGVPSLSACEGNGVTHPWD